MKVLHIANDYRCGNLYEKLISKIEDKKIFDQVVYVPSSTYIKNINNVEFEIIYSKSFNCLDRIFFYKKANKIYKDLLTNINVKKMKLVHAHTMFSNGIIAYQIFKNYGIEYIVSVRGTDIHVFFKKLLYLRKIGIDILLNAKRIIFISPAIKKNLLLMINDTKIANEINQKSLILTNGIDDFWFYNKIMDTNYPKKDNINILHVGWYSKNKNQLNTIKAIELLNNEGFDCSLTMIGGTTNRILDRIYKNKILKKIDTSKYKRKISCNGKQNKNDLLKAYRDAHVFVLPSYQETFGLTYIEALSQNIPIVYSKNQGVDGLFNNKPVGVAIDPNDIKSIAWGIKEVYIKDEYKKNIRYAIDRFKWNDIVNRLVNVYIN